MKNQVVGFTVFVDGGEVNDYYLSLDQALDMASDFIEDGYHPVIQETEFSVSCCDHCGSYRQPLYHYGIMPFSTASTLVGESASICLPCEKVLKKKGKNESQ